MNVLFFEVSLLLYFLGTALFLSQLAGRLEAVSQSAFVVAGSAFFFHTLALVSRMIEGGHLPLTTIHKRPGEERQHFVHGGQRDMTKLDHPRQQGAGMEKKDATCEHEC